MFGQAIVSLPSRHELGKLCRRRGLCRRRFTRRVAAPAGLSAPRHGPTASTLPSSPVTPRPSPSSCSARAARSRSPRSRSIPLSNKTGDVWHVFVHGLPADTLYGYRVSGPFAPKSGHRFDPSVVLLDPYARAVSGNPALGPARRAARPGRTAGCPAAAASSPMISTGRTMRRRRRLWRRRSSTNCTCAATRAMHRPPSPTPAPTWD